MNLRRWDSILSTVRELALAGDTSGAVRWLEEVRDEIRDEIRDNETEKT